MFDKAKMQLEAVKAQKKLMGQIFEAEAGNSAVTVKMNGLFQVKGVNIDREKIDLEDTERLEKLIESAFNQVVKQVLVNLSEQAKGSFPGL